LDLLAAVYDAVQKVVGFVFWEHPVDNLSAARLRTRTTRADPKGWIGGGASRGVGDGSPPVGPRGKARNWNIFVNRPRQPEIKAMYHVLCKLWFAANAVRYCVGHVVTCYGGPLSVSGRPCYNLPMFYLFIYFLWPLHSPALVVQYNNGSAVNVDY